MNERKWQSQYVYGFDKEFRIDVTYSDDKEGLCTIDVYGKVTPDALIYPNKLTAPLHLDREGAAKLVKILIDAYDFRIDQPLAGVIVR